MENNQNQINPEVKKVAPEYESHKKWMKENSVMINARLLKSTDADILEYLEGKNKQAEIKKGRRRFYSICIMENGLYAHHT